MKILWHGEAISAGDPDRNKKETKTEDDMGRQHGRMQMNAMWRFPEAAEDMERWTDTV